jgi:protein TonB
VQESLLIRRVEPKYPELARRARISGVVILKVTVDEEGDVSEVRVLRGLPLLQEAAVEAVRQWKYSPTYLNGEPVPVSAAVTVIFNLR